MAETAVARASTTAGSKSVPEQRRSSAIASSAGRALRYERSVVIALKASLDGGTIPAGGTWKPSPQIGMLGGVLPLLVSFRFTAVGGAAAIDDVYLDPMKSS